MARNITIPDHIDARTEFKKRYGLGELYRASAMLPAAAGKISTNRRTKLVDAHLIERMQLAVTEVNGCSVCSYAHAYMALKQGMGNDEIHSFLSGDGNFVKPEEAKAILFAQHFADTRGFPKHAAYASIRDAYGDQEAQVMLCAAQIMLVGNIYGIPYSALRSRLKGRPYKDSSIWYELGMLLGGFVLVPFALVHGLLRILFGVSNIRNGG